MSVSDLCVQLLTIVPCRPVQLCTFRLVLGQSSASKPRGSSPLIVVSPAQVPTPVIVAVPAPLITHAVGRFAIVACPLALITVPWPPPATLGAVFSSWPRRVAPPAFSIARELHITAVRVRADPVGVLHNEVVSASTGLSASLRLCAQPCPCEYPLPGMSHCQYEDKVQQVVHCTNPDWGSLKRQRRIPDKTYVP